MVGRLCLSGTALLVYAVIYSFHESGGSCHASREYLARRVGVSERAVSSAVSELVSRGFVLKTGNCRNTELKIDVEALSRPRPYVDEDSSREKKLPERGKNLTVKGEESSTNTKRDNKIITSSSSASAIARAMANVEKQMKQLRRVGRNQMATMTFEQYEHLKNLMGEEILEEYIYRLCCQMRKANGYIHSGYKTVLKWYREDTECEAKD